MISRLVGLMAATMLAATFGGDARAQELLLGYLPALAGPFATLSRTDEIAAQIAVDEINAAFRRRLDPTAFTIVKAGDFQKAGAYTK